MPSTRSTDLWASVQRVLEAEGLRHEAAKEGRAARIATVGANGRWFTFARLDGESMLRFFAISPISATEASRLAATELAARVNFGLPVAALELDVESGDLRMRTTVDGEPLAGASLEVVDACVRAAFWACVSAMDVYLPAILRVIELGEPVMDALARAEADRS